MKISLTIRTLAQCYTVFAEIGLATPRPELHKLCRHAANEKDVVTTESLAKFFPKDSIADSGLRNLVTWMEVLNLAKNKRLTKIGSDLADNPQGIVYIPEKNLFRLTVLSHAVTGTVTCRLTRKPPKELYGTAFTELVEGKTEPIPRDFCLKPGIDYVALQDDEAFRFVNYCGEPVAIRHRPIQMEINLLIQSNNEKNEANWRLRGKDIESKHQLASPELINCLKDVIQDICARSPKGRWNGEQLEGRFADFNPEERKQFKGTLSLTEGLTDVTYVGEVVSAQIIELPIRPINQTEAELWINERIHLLNIGQPRTRSQLIALINRNLEKHENVFHGYNVTIPTNSVLIQNCWANEDSKKREDYWHLQTPFDLAPKEATEKDAPIDLFVQGHRHTGRLAKSTGLTIEHHQLLEYPELLEALWDETETPTEILICDRHMFAYPQSEQLPKLLESMRAKWPNCKIELWYSNSKDNKNSTQLIQDCTNRGHKVQTIQTQFTDGKIHDRFILLKCASRPMSVWGASNTLLSPKQFHGKLRWPQVNLSRMKPEQTHTEIRKWAK